jgi:Fe-S oxidoreductase
LDRLDEYSLGVERINIEQSIANKLAVCDAFLDYLDGDLPEVRQAPDYEESEEYGAIVAAKVTLARRHLERVRSDWQALLDHMDAPAAQYPDLLDDRAAAELLADDTLFDLLQRRALRVSYRASVAKPLKEIFAGLDLQGVCARLDRIHERIKSSRLFVALHMHAGDGNVHTNIPVNSNDYAMLQEADRIVDRIMALATSLGGVISGEHGIGLTKIGYMPQQALEEFAAYKQRVDPQGRFNRGKLMPGSGLARAYTPSLRLVQQEALILEATELGALNDDIRDCLRCGKCKPVCTTHVPRANLLYSPRNKILATGLIIEAVLYEEQTRRGISLRHFDEMNDVADHCTVCHRCERPCPVNIDFGDVSIRMRTLLKEQGKKRFNAGSWASMAFLNVTDPRAVKLLHWLMIRFGYAGQRLAHRLFARWLRRDAPPGATTGPTPLVEQVVHFLERPMPAGLPSRTARALLEVEDDKTVPILRDPRRTGIDSEAVFYFPGCGSERLFGQVGLATLAMLYEQGVQTVLPPGYLCCGYPQTAGGDRDRGQAISIANRVLFHRVANTLNYLDIKTVLVSCGTCMDQLLQYEFDRIFPGCRLLDIHEYLLEKGVVAESDADKGVQYLYHAPCHDPMKTHNSTRVAGQLLGRDIPLNDRCCGESGSFAIARPDIAAQVKFRKREELQAGVGRVTGRTPPLPETGMEDTGPRVKVLTTCPSCQQGLARYRHETGAEPDYIVVEMARRLLGEDWQGRFVEQARRGGIERVLL